MKPPRYTFVGGPSGSWKIESIRAVAGEGLPAAAYLDVNADGPDTLPPGANWILRGVVSNTRYTSRAEQDQLAAVQPPLGRPEATCAALIPMSKNAAWWALSQDERQAIFRDRATHTATGLRYLPAIARRLHHGRDLGEPFDFLTWFEFAPADAPAFDDLLSALRSTEEWRYVECEVEVRLVHAVAPTERRG